MPNVKVVLGVHTRGLKVGALTEVCTLMFKAALSTMEKSRSDPRVH